MNFKLYIRIYETNLNLYAILNNLNHYYVFSLTTSKSIKYAEVNFL